MPFRSIARKNASMLREHKVHSPSFHLGIWNIFLKPSSYMNLMMSQPPRIVASYGWGYRISYNNWLAASVQRSADKLLSQIRLIGTEHRWSIQFWQHSTNVGTRLPCPNSPNSGSHTRRWLMHYQTHDSDDGPTVIRQKKIKINTIIDMSRGKHY